MPNKNSAEMTLERFTVIVQSYGGDPQRWPPAEREAAELWLVSNPQSQALQAEASRLDRALGVGELPAVPDALARRLMGDFDRAERRWSLRKLADAIAETVWPGAPVWQPACALGIAFAAGLGVAVFAPLEIPDQDDLSSNVFALDGVSDVDAGHGI